MEQFSFWLQAIISILSGLAVLIPMLITLVRFIKVAAKEKNWSQVMRLIMNLMAEAEEKFDDGPSRKDWVICELEAVAHTLNYDIDWEIISNMIDQICAVSKKVNK